MKQSTQNRKTTAEITAHHWQEKNSRNCNTLHTGKNRRNCSIQQTGKQQELQHTTDRKTTVETVACYREGR
jgi:hypothetical protein